AGNLSERPAVLERAKNSHRLIKQLQRFAFFPHPEIRYTQVIESLSLSNAIARGLQQRQRLHVIVDRCLLFAEIVMYFADAIEDPADELVIACSSRERQGLSGVRESLLPVTELDVDEGDRIQRSCLLCRIISGVPL